MNTCKDCNVAELCVHTGTDCSIYTAENIAALSINQGDNLTEVIQKLSEGIASASVVAESEVFDSMVLNGIPPCLTGKTFLPITWAMTTEGVFTYSLENLLNNLPSDIGLVRTRVRLYHNNTTVINSDLPQGGTNLTNAQLPAFVDVDVVLSTTCGLVTLNNTFSLVCDLTGQFSVSLSPKIETDVSVTNQAEMNAYLVNEAKSFKSLLGTQVSNLLLPTSDLFPNHSLSPSNAITVLSGALLKLEDRIKEIETVESCSSDCQDCPGGTEQTLKDVIKEICQLVKEQATTIETLQSRIVNLEAFP